MKKFSYCNFGILLPGPVEKHVPALTREQLKQCRSDLEHFYHTGILTLETDPVNPRAVIGLKRIFTRMVINQEDKRTGQKIAIEYTNLRNLFKRTLGGYCPKRILLQGEGGAGKTTLCAKIVLDWIEKTDFQEFEMVLMIPLHDQALTDKTVGQIAKTYLSDSNTVEPEQIDAFIVSNPDKVFLLLDAFDEMNAGLSDLNYIVEIIGMKRLETCTVLVTARPWKAELILKISALRMAYEHVFVEGFHKAVLSAYVNRFFDGDRASAEDLIQFMADNDVLAEIVAPFPIYAAMICIMWREFNGERRMQMQRLQTASQLFAEMIEFLSDRFFHKHDEGVQSSNAKTNVDQCLAQIAKVAFQGLLIKKMTVTEDDFHSNQVMETGCALGILTREYRGMPREEIKRKGEEAQYSVVFQHKLFQEYLAASHLASLSETNRDEFDDVMRNTIVPSVEEYKHLLYFASSKGKAVTMEIANHVKILVEQHSHLLHSFVVDFTFESQQPEVALEVWTEQLARQKELELRLESAHRVSGYMYIMKHCPLVSYILSLFYR